MTASTHSAYFWIGLRSVPGIGRITFRRLVRHFGSPEGALTAGRDALMQLGWLPRKVVNGLEAFPWRERAEQELEHAEKAGVGLITLDDPSYPDNLKKTPDPPPYLYVRGALIPEDENAVAIVGTRRPTHYGAKMTEQLARELASAGFTIVSGMARGIDTGAHKGALTVKGRTIAVLGCGIDVAYPPENRGLMEEISRTCAVVTENPFGTRPEAGYFPARNRIISGLSRGTVIVEAADDSGSLITAKYALEQGRRLYAVPGNVGSPVSKGTNSLIKQGATLIEGAADVLRDFGVRTADALRQSAQPPLPPLSGEEAAALRSLTDEPKHIDVIMRECGMTAGTLSAALISLELKGLAGQLPGKYFTRRVLGKS